jgi:hypothetical protein
VETNEVAGRQRAALGAACLTCGFLGFIIGMSGGWLAGSFGIFLPIAVLPQIILATERAWLWLFKSAGIFALATLMGLLLCCLSIPSYLPSVPLLALLAFIAALLLGLPGTLLVVLVRWYKSRK